MKFHCTHKEMKFTLKIINIYILAVYAPTQHLHIHFYSLSVLFTRERDCFALLCEVISTIFTTTQFFFLLSYSRACSHILRDNVLQFILVLIFPRIIFIIIIAFVALMQKFFIFLFILFDSFVYSSSSHFSCPSLNMMLIT